MDFTIPEELRQVKRMARDFVQKELLPRENEIEETGEIPLEIVQKIKDLGFFGITIPPEYGGMGIGCLGFCLIAEEFGWANACYRDVRYLRFIEGTSEIQRMIMARDVLKS